MMHHCQGKLLNVAGVIIIFILFVFIDVLFVVVLGRRRSAVAVGVALGQRQFSSFAQAVFLRAIVHRFSNGVFEFVKLRIAVVMDMTHVITVHITITAAVERAFVFIMNSFGVVPVVVDVGAVEVSFSAAFSFGAERLLVLVLVVVAVCAVVVKRSAFNAVEVKFRCFNKRHVRLVFAEGTARTVCAAYVS